MPELNDLKPLATLALDAALVFLWKPPTSVSKGGDVPEGLVPPGYSLPGVDDLPSVLAFAALAALMIAIVGSRNSPSIAPWLVKPRACGLLAMQFVIQIVHHANATCITQELKSPGWSAIGRMNHHLIDGFCHTSFTLVACFLYRNAAGKTERPTKLFLLLWIGMCMAGQQWETGGQSYRLKYHQPELFERHESTLRGALEQTFAPQYDIINPKSPGGAHLLVVRCQGAAGVRDAGWRGRPVAFQEGVGRTGGHHPAFRIQHRWERAVRRGDRDGG